MDTSSPLVAVAGATGEVGGRVARALAGHVPLRVLARDAGRAADVAGELRRGGQPLPQPPRVPRDAPDAGRAGGAIRDSMDGTGGPRIESAAAEYGDLAAAESALAGVSVLFMVSAAESADRLEQHRTFIDAAAAAGVAHVVYTSFLAAAPDAVFTLGRDHFHTEEHLKAAGPQWTMLRDNFYQDVFPLFAGPDGVLRGPAGEGRVSAVSREDVAECAAVVLLDTARALAAGQPGPHAGRTYHLTGPEAFTLGEAAGAITTATGRPTAFHHESLEEAYASRASYGAPDWQVEAWVSTYTAIASGQLEQVTGDVPALLGRPARSLAQTLGGAPAH